MKILWLGHNLAYPPKGGVLQRNYNLLREAARRCEVHFLGFDQVATRPDGVSPEDCVRSLRGFCASADWVPLERGDLRSRRCLLALAGIVSQEPFDVRWLRSRDMTNRVERLLRHGRFDVVHVDTLGLAPYRRVLEASGAVLNHHNIESSMMLRRARNSRSVLVRHYMARQAHKLYKAEVRWCPRFELNLVVSREDGEILKNSLPGVETAVVANGVDIDYFTPRPDPSGKTLLFCGTLDWYPNIDAMKFFFDSIWPRLMQRRHDVQICVVGKNPPKWLERLSKTDNRIHVPGYVEDARPYFRRATVYVCPIRDGGGTRLKILDALAMGLPLIATSFACSGLSLEREKHALLAETPDQFVHEIDRALSDVALRVNLATAGRELIERLYSWNVIGQDLIRAYERACEVRSAVRAE